MAEERRLVTVLFADIVGSTVLAESLDPEDIRALLARFFAIAKDVVPAHGGTMEKFIGDAVMPSSECPRRMGTIRSARCLQRWNSGIGLRQIPSSAFASPSALG